MVDLSSDEELDQEEALVAWEARCQDAAAQVAQQQLEVPPLQPAAPPPQQVADGGALESERAVLPDFKHFDSKVAWYLERLDEPCFPGARLTLRQQIYVKLLEKGLRYA